VRHVHDDRGLEGPRQRGGIFVGGSERLPSVAGSISASVMPQPVSDESQSEGPLRPATPFPGERRRQEQVDQRHDPIECCRRITGGNQPWLSTLVCSSRQRRRLRARRPIGGHLVVLGTLTARDQARDWSSYLRVREWLA